ncbi:MAG TPA: hypothetical protein VMM38_15395 [Aridibacter sp.]|nr:hypothetical protein [Aridibacter sp.]
MNRILKQLYSIAFVAVLLTLATSGFAQTQPYRVRDRQVQTLLNRIETKSDAFRRSIEQVYDNDNRNNTYRQDGISDYVTNFENATDVLKRNFEDRRSTANDVQEILNRASYINSFMRQNRVTPAAQNQWNSLRTDLNRLANYYRVTWNWNSTSNIPIANRPYYVADSDVKSLLERIEQRTDVFRRDLDVWLDRSRFNETNREDNVSEYASNFERATDDLRRNFDGSRSVSADVETVLRQGALIDRFVNRNRLSASVENQWRLIRNDLSTLSRYYRVNWDWNNPTYADSGTIGYDSRLTGTYRLNVRQSDDVPRAIDSAIRNINYNNNQREQVKQRLLRRLASPEMLMIEKRGQQVTLATSTSAQISFNADGVERTETSPNGRTVRVRATSTNDDLIINYEGDRVNDYYVSFTPSGNNQLRISRRIYLENRNETVTIASVYDRTDRNVQWNTSTYPGTTDYTIDGDFVIPNGTRVVARLDTPLSTKTARAADRFSMTVTSPSQYYGAVIEGSVVGEKSGMVSGRANLSLLFETIRLQNGKTYRFAGIVEQVREPDGSEVSVNNEGVVRDGNQTNRTVTRTGIGAVLGAIIGAIAGGGEGAAIGAGIGAGAGVGSVILQGRDNLDLAVGTEFSITAAGPRNLATNR